MMKVYTELKGPSAHLGENHGATAHGHSACCVHQRARVVTLPQVDLAATVETCFFKRPMKNSKQKTMIRHVSVHL